TAPPDRLASCGRPSVFCRTALLGEDGRPVPRGELGEICVAGPLVAAGYWHRPEATSETFAEDWMHTGDVAREDEDGFWYIVDRTKDMIVSGGFNGVCVRFVVLWARGSCRVRTGAGCGGRGR